jgi:glycosyltransferase involved in cell wall biosynthesis
LLAPSLKKGFEIHVAQALIAGCQIICSDIPAFRELGGNRCVYIPLNDMAEHAFADAICAGIRQHPCEPVTLPQLSAPIIAEQYLQLYRSLLYPASAFDTSPLRAAAETPEGSRTL